MSLIVENPSLEVMPCPWCGGVDRLCVEENSQPGFWAVHCNDCGASGPSGGISPDDAAVKWNIYAMRQEAMRDPKELSDGDVNKLAFALMFLGLIACALLAGTYAMWVMR